MAAQFISPIYARCDGRISELHANRKHFVCTSLLAQRIRGNKRPAHAGEVGTHPEKRDPGKVHPGRLPDKARRAAGKGADGPVTTIAIECESEPVQDTDYVRKNKPRDGV